MAQHARLIVASYMPNAEHSGDLGMATKEPWKGRPAAIGRVLLRLVKGLFTLGFYWAPNAECQLPILCASLTHCARNQATEGAEVPRRLRRIAPRPELQITRRSRCQT